MQGDAGKFANPPALPQRDLNRRKRDRGRRDQRARGDRKISKRGESGADQPFDRPGLGTRQQDEAEHTEKEQEVELDLEAGQRVVPTERYCIEKQRKYEQKHQRAEFERPAERDQQKGDRSEEHTP